LLTNLGPRVLRRALSFAAWGIRAGRAAVERTPGRPRRDVLRLIVLDPGLNWPGGHHFEFALLLRSQLASIRKLTFYGHASAGPIAAAAVNARPIFRDDVYPNAPGVPFGELYRAMTESMGSALAAVDPADLHATTIAVSHTTTIFQIGGLAQWYSSLAASRRPRLFVQFQHPIDWLVEPFSERPRATALAKKAAHVLAVAGTVRFAANSQTLARRISAELDQPCALMPVPVRWPDAGSLGAPERGVVYGFFGGLRREKGALLLAPAIASIANRYPEARFIIHAPTGSDPDALRALQHLPHVELIRKTFARKADYFAAVARVRWILLPYDPKPYAVRTSGIFIEAQGLGIPVVVTPGTWMADELRARGSRGLIMSDYSATALADCLAEARQVMLATDPAAPRPDPSVIAEHSAANFCTSILDLMASGTASLDRQDDFPELLG
jgi:glycosyltransferase involved in cell wall biosynthesis